MRPPLLALVLFVAASPAAAQVVTALRGVTVVDGTGAPPIPDAVVLIRDGRIAAVGPARAVSIPRGARIVEGRGRWVIPGLIDMHAHITLGPVTLAAGTMRMEPAPEVPGQSLRSLLAWGVTTIRDPGAVAELAVAVRDSVQRGLLSGPRVFTAGEVVDRSVVPGLVATVQTEDQMIAEVRRQAALGVDYVKLYATLSPELVRAGVLEAHRLGLKVLIHPFATSWTEAAEAGVDGIVHAPPGSAKLLPPDRRAPFLRGIQNGRFLFQWFEYADFTAPQVDTMLRAMVAHRVVHDPTLVVFEAVAWGDSARITASPDLAFAPPSLLANWRGEFQLSVGWRPAEFDSARAVWPAVLRFVRLLHDRGVFLVAGTDANNPWVAPGPSLHRELELLHEAGIPPLEVLRIATRNGAEALGILAETGTVEAGKRADLVVLEGDPVADLANTRRIALVVQGGRMMRPADILAGRR